MAKVKEKSETTPLRRWLKRAGLFVFGFVAGVHLYAVVLKWAPVPGTILMIDRGFAGEDVRRDGQRLEKISPHLVRAVIAAEDTGFCSHKGVDGEAIKKALDERADGKKLRGASTITQQTAKNVFFWNGGGLVRKGGEAWMATVIDTLWGKRRVMEVYLNVAEWGDGLFGAEAAAQARFGKSAADLTEREAALLAAVLPNPNKWRVDPPGPYVQKRAGTLQARMRTVRAQGLDLCVLEKTAEGVATPKPKPEAKPKLEPETTVPQQEPSVPEVESNTPDVIEPEDTETETKSVPEMSPDDPLSAVLDSADEALEAQPPADELLESHGYSVTPQEQPTGEAE